MKSHPVNEQIVRSAARDNLAVHAVDSACIKLLAWEHAKT